MRLGVDLLMGKYETCLPEYGRLLPELAGIIGAEYRGGAYREAKERLYREYIVRGGNPDAQQKP